MGIRDFTKKWVVDIAPNAKWDLTRYVLLTALTCAAALSIWATARLVPLLNKLTAQEKVIAFTLVVGFCAISFVSLLWVLFIRASLTPLYRLVESFAKKSRLEQEPNETNATASLPPPPVPLTPSPARLPLVKEVDLHIEVLDVIFEEHPAGPYGALLTGARDGWYILMQLRITNRGAVEATVTRWEFEPIVTGKETPWTIGEAVVTAIPANWYVEKPSRHFGAAPVRVEIERPTLDQRADREPLKPRIPQTGWVLFDLTMSSEYFGPQNAAFQFGLHDSVGKVHRHLEPATWSKKTGEIRHALSPEDLAKEIFPSDAKK